MSENQKDPVVGEIRMTHEDKMAIANATTTVFPGAYYRSARTLIVKFPGEDRTVEVWLNPNTWTPQMMAVFARSLRMNKVLAQCPMEVTLDWICMTDGVIAVRVEDEITSGIKAGCSVMRETFDDGVMAAQIAAQMAADKKAAKRAKWAKIKGWFTRKPKEGSDAVRSHADADAGH